MDINGLYRTGHFTTEAGPAVLRIFDSCLFYFVHDDHIARAYQRADTATHAGPFIDIANHLTHLLIEDLIVSCNANIFPISGNPRLAIPLEGGGLGWG